MGCWEKPAITINGREGKLKWSLLESEVADEEHDNI
jgi:hypothetical protein